MTKERKRMKKSRRASESTLREVRDVSFRWDSSESGVLTARDLGVKIFEVKLSREAVSDLLSSISPPEVDVECGRCGDRARVPADIRGMYPSNEELERVGWFRLRFNHVVCPKCVVPGLVEWVRELSSR